MKAFCWVCERCATRRDDNQDTRNEQATFGEVKCEECDQPMTKEDADV